MSEIKQENTAQTEESQQQLAPAQGQFDLSQMTAQEQREFKRAYFFENWKEAAGFGRKPNSLHQFAMAGGALALFGSIAGSIVAENIYNAPQNDPAYERSNHVATLASGERIMINLERNEVLLADVDSERFTPLNPREASIGLSEVVGNLEAANILLENHSNMYSKHIEGLGSMDMVSQPHTDRHTPRYRLAAEFRSITDTNQSSNANWLDTEQAHWQTALISAQNGGMQTFDTVHTSRTNKDNIDRVSWTTAGLVFGGMMGTWLTLYGVGGAIRAGRRTRDLSL